MMRCSHCGNELQEGAIICTFCGRVVQYRTHFSTAEIEPPLLPGSQLREEETTRHSDLYRLAAFFLISLLIAYLVMLGISSPDTKSVVRNQWSTRITISKVLIDRYSYEDRVVVSGRITNVGDRNMQGVIIHAYVMNAVSQQIGEVYYSVAPEIMLPDAGAEFTVSIPCRVDLVRQVKVEIFDAQEQPEIIRPKKWSGLWGVGG